MSRALPITLLLVVGCGAPVTEGSWHISEVMSHRCRGVGDTGLVCEADEALPRETREGTIRIDDLGSGRLRLIAVDGRTNVGRSYDDGARFRWHEQRVDDQGCSEISDEVLELVSLGETLSGQRRVYAALGVACESTSITDEGFVVTAEPVESAR